MKKPLLAWPLLALSALTACVGGTFGNHNEIEQYPLRGATDAEASRLKPCLLAAHRAQERQKKETGAYYKRASELPVDAFCQGFMLTQKRTQEGYEIIAQFHENDTTVRWSVNRQGVVEEHLDPEYNDDLEF